MSRRTLERDRRPRGRVWWRSEAHAVDLAVATEVGEQYLNATSSPRDSRVTAAYQRLAAETDLLFGAVLRDDGPCSVRIVFTRCVEPYGSDQELIEAVRACRILEVTTAAISPRRMHPVLGCELGGPFDRFRAIHDLVGHVIPGFGFDLAGEYAAWLKQSRMHGGLARRALATELYGVNSARWVAGEAPEHKAVLIESGALCGPSGEYGPAQTKTSAHRLPTVFPTGTRGHTGQPGYGAPR
jgi:hypothetical protein